MCFPGEGPIHEQAGRERFRTFARRFFVFLSPGQRGSLKLYSPAEEEDSDYQEHPIAPVATAYEPQTAEKVEVMRGRVAAGFQPCKLGDAQKRCDVEREARHLANGAQDKATQYRNVVKVVERPDSEEDAKTEFLADLAAMRLGRKGDQ